jgi:hypothetical protein
MSRLQRMRRLAGVLAWLAGILAWQSLVVTGGPASAASAAWLSAGCRIAPQLFGPPLAVCDTSSASIVACSLIPLSGAPFGSMRRERTPRGEQQAAMDCPGPYPFGGVILMPSSRR